MNKCTQKQLILICFPVIIPLIVIFLVNFFMTRITQGLALNDVYWIIRSKPFLIMTFTSALSLLFIQIQAMHLRKYALLGSSLALFVTVSYYGSYELMRLNQYVGFNGREWKHVLPYFDHMLLAGIVTGTLILSLSGKFFKPSSDFKKAKKSSFGEASWLSMKNVAHVFPDDGDIIIGERYRVDEDHVKDVAFSPSDKTTWGKGGKEPLLTSKLDFGSTHMMFFAGSGGYKTTSTVIPTCLKYGGSIVCLDPSAEVAPIVCNARRSMGRSVMNLDPNGRSTKSFNVLDWLLDKSVPLAQREANIVGFAKLLLSDHKNEDANSNYFSTQAHNLLTGLLAHVVFSDEYREEERNLKTLRALISQPEKSVMEKLEKIQQETPSNFIKETLGVFINMTEQTFSGVYSTASKDTQWLSLSNYAYLVCGDHFKSSDIVKGNIDIFLNIPSNILNSYPGIGRVIVGAFLNAMIAADGHYEKRVLFVLDEVDLLGYMNILEEARDRGRKYGISLMMFYQSSGQLVNHFGNAGAQAWIESCSFISYAAIKDLATAKEISDKCGQTTIEIKGKSRNIGSFSRGTETTNLQHRPLIMPHEIIQNMRQDEQIILMQGKSPIRCGRAIYFRRKEFLALAEENRFASPYSSTKS